MRIAFATLIAVLAGWQSAAATEIKLLAPAPFNPIITALLPDYQKQTGNKVNVVNDSAGRLIAKILRENESFDVLVASPVPLKDLARQGKVAGDPVLLAQDGMGVVVKEGAPKPDISSRDALKKALLDAHKVAFGESASLSGVYVDQLFYRLGIQKQMEPKGMEVRGSPVAEHVVNGEADLGIHPISEILAVKGAALVGPIPGPLQDYIVYAGGISAASKNADAAKKLLAVFSSDKARQVLKDKGMEPPQG